MLPAAIVLILGGAVACFGGYGLFRIVLGIYGFILGAMMASSVMGVTNTFGMIVAAVIGGLVGAVVLSMAYFVGIGLVGAGLAVVIGQAAWSVVASGDPPWIIVAVVAVAGAIGAMLLQRYVLIMATAFGGAWTLVIGAVNALDARGGGRGTPVPEVWILYPASSPDQRRVLMAWIAFGLAGLAVQLATTTKGRKK
jgi:hypothetical protein